MSDNGSVTGSNDSTTPPALTPEDYYLENGLMVFTAAYHLKRGYCCGSGCRHCPYRETDAAGTKDTGSAER
ncbi:MAG TPA: DUF5522 domain-containing protein [Terracidiphilus sp.]